MYKTTTLKNNLEIITQHDSNKDIVTLSYLVKCGCYDEVRENLGIAHFVEHMLFKGTTNRNAQQIFEEIEGIGGILNAATSFEHTRYYCTVPSEYWKMGIDILSDLIWNNLIPKDEFKKEKQVILEELKMYQDDSSSKVFDLLLKSLHPSYINRQTIGGTIESVSNITRNQMLKFIDKYYIPKNIVIIATGNVNHNELVSFIDKYCSSIELQDYKLENKNNFVPDKLGHDDLIEKREIAQSHLAWGMFGPKPSEKEFIISEVVTSLLCGSSSSRLYQIIREQQGLCYTIHMDNISLSDISIINGYVGLDHNNISNVKKIILEEINKLKEENVTEEELNRVKKYIIGTEKISLETTSSKSSYITDCLINKTERTIDEYFEEIESVTQDDIKIFAKKYFKEDNICFTQIIPR
ncbi:MAG: M16 family metallopeptidase [bacterium]